MYGHLPYTRTAPHPFALEEPNLHLLHQIASAQAPHLTVLQAIILGIVQGLTEFAPVSSSGHLILVPWLGNWSILHNEQLNKTFDVALHIGTFVGAIGYFRHDIVRYLKAWFHSIRTRRAGTMDERIAWYIVIGTIPGAVVGILFEDVIEEKLGEPWLIAVMLAIFAVVLLIVDRKAPQDHGLEGLTMKRSLLIGVAQAVSLQPGVSRSGVTVTAARGTGMTRESAARFSFLLALPIIGGAGLYKGFQLATGSQHMPAGFAGPFIAGMIASAVAGFLVIWGLLAYLRRGSFLPFVIYRLAVCAIVLGLIAGGVRPATV
ncbi:MAG TPA: undecaprenyl-diphosphate phosphatase [Actinomycetota bacterium]